MASAELMADAAAKKHDWPYCLDIEGVNHGWPVSIILAEQVAELGGWDMSAGVVLVDAENNERQLKSGEIVRLKPGDCFSKRVSWKRGR